ncbi:MAG: hypothetical protein SFV24_07825 [Gemmatimonadales bacterium]|nr:hypothetical protein [Gemmatimonadales bacterium]
MSRAFVKEDGDGAAPRYSLPPTGDPGFARAAARALLIGANNGDTASAEEATGRLWGDPALIEPMRQLLAEALERGDDRTEVLAARYLRAAGAEVD